MIPIKNHNKEDLSHRLTKVLDDGIIKENKKEKIRNYLGASILGNPCDRQLQYQYTNTKKDYEFPGSKLRIFDVGHVFEDLAIKWLRSSGFELLTKDSKGNQFGFSFFRNKIKGHVDGVITNAPAELGFKFPMLWECKSLNQKSWKSLVRNGLQLDKPVYATQFALYQKYMNNIFDGINDNPGLFMAINKNTSEVYSELVLPGQGLINLHLRRAVIILTNVEKGILSKRITHRPDYWQCRYCDYRDRCWA